MSTIKSHTHTSKKEATHTMASPNLSLQRPKSQLQPSVRLAALREEKEKQDASNQARRTQCTPVLDARTGYVDVYWMRGLSEGLSEVTDQCSQLSAAVSPMGGVSRLEVRCSWVPDVSPMEGISEDISEVSNQCSQLSVAVSPMGGILRSEVRCSQVVSDVSLTEGTSEVSERCS